MVTVPIWQHILSAGRWAAKHASLRYADAPNDGATAITSIPPPPQLRLKQRPPFAQVKLIYTDFHLYRDEFNYLSF